LQNYSDQNIKTYSSLDSLIFPMLVKIIDNFKIVCFYLYY